MKLKIIDGNKPDEKPEIKWNHDHDDLEMDEIYMDSSGYIFGVGVRNDELPKDTTKPIFGVLGVENTIELGDDRIDKDPFIQLPAEAISLTIDLSKLRPELAEWIREKSK